MLFNNLRPIGINKLQHFSFNSCFILWSMFLQSWVNWMKNYSFKWLNISTIKSIEGIQFYINQTFFYVDKMLTLKDWPIIWVILYLKFELMVHWDGGQTMTIWVNIIKCTMDINWLRILLQECKVIKIKYIEMIVERLNERLFNLLIFNSWKLFGPKYYLKRWRSSYQYVQTIVENIYLKF